jgi:hypothetical protein
VSEPAGARCSKALRRKAEHLVLAGPFRRQVGEASDTHAMREPASDGGCSELATDNRLVGSSSKQRFPGVVQIGQLAGFVCGRSVSADEQLNVTGLFRPLSLPCKIAFPGNRDQQLRRLVRMG